MSSLEHPSCCMVGTSMCVHVSSRIAEGWTAVVVRGAAVDWNVDRRFRVTEVALAIVWCSASAYLSYFFTDCMMSRWLVNYTPPAVIIRLLTINCLIAYLTTWILYLSGASSDPRLLLPAWISITSILTLLYHLTQRKINIKKETKASLSVFSIASFISMSSVLLQLHLSRENEPEIPLFAMIQKAWNRWHFLSLHSGVGLDHLVIFTLSLLIFLCFFSFLSGVGFFSDIIHLTIENYLETSVTFIYSLSPLSYLMVNTSGFLRPLR
ncbi:conserved hypothetical protein [Microsporum canis CBS 113480]|uniref:Uncharacterized protein n=1 Tax=Arthroderma otae (strain ATCC MYA-4605 / CBS 113480) TaxID=554155 RepID=C5FZG0_ARTOC|nr:conserved hypothetical protein [Microsporum canis CBS 113480]EEQ35263.1 conserved hypothetical protein [Microsporum canis CBS 113480]